MPRRSPDSPTAWRTARSLGNEPATRASLSPPVEERDVLPPQVPALALERPDLLERVRRATADRLTCLVAPAGYGKTVLLSQWHAIEHRRALAWVTLDDRDGEPHRFVDHLTNALERCWGELPAELHGRLDGAGARFSEVVGGAAVGHPETVVVLDGVEELAPSTTADLTALALHAPGTLHFVLSSRYDLLPVAAAVRRRHGVVLLSAEELAFDQDEIGQLCAHAGLHVAPSEIEQLWARTEGWPLVVHCAVQAADDPRSAAIEHHGRDERFVHYYLRSEVVARLPPHLQNFAVLTSVPDRFSVPLADSLVGENSSASLLDELVGHGVPIRARTEKAGLFSYPPVLTECLRNELRTNEPGREEALLRLAAEWHRARGELVRPINYLLRAGAFEEAIDVMIANACDLYRAGRAVDALSWLRAVPRPIRRAQPAATLVLAAMCQRAGEAVEADALLDELEHDPAGESEFSRSIDTVRCLGIEYHHPAADVLARAQRVLVDANGAGGGEAGRHNASQRRGHQSCGFLPTDRLPSAALVSGGRALVGLGRLGEAREWCEAGLGDPLVTPDLRVQLLGVLGRTEAKSGLLRAANRHAAQALVPTSEIDVVDDTDRADAYLALAVAALERASLDEAARFLLEAERRARVNRRSSLVAAIVAQKARASLLAGRVAEGLTNLEQLYAAGDPDPPPAVAARLAAVEARLWLASGEPGRGAHVLAAESFLTVEIAEARAQLAVAAHDRDALLAVLDAWQELVDGDEPLPAVSRLLWSSCAAQLGDDTDRARHGLDDALRLAEPEGLCAVFLESGHAVLRQLAALLPASARPRLADKIWGTPPRPRRGPDGPPSGVDTLSERELMVLRHLDRDLDEEELAAALYISVNTLKTHLKHIYRKLGVRTRLQAVLCASDLGLLQT